MPTETPLLRSIVRSFSRMFGLVIPSGSPSTGPKYPQLHFWLINNVHENRREGGGSEDVTDKDVLNSQFFQHLLFCSIEWSLIYVVSGPMTWIEAGPFSHVANWAVCMAEFAKLKKVCSYLCHFLSSLNHIPNVFEQLMPSYLWHSLEPSPL